MAAQRELKVLALGLPRTGSASIAEALTILGYKDVYHGSRFFDSPGDLRIFSRAADATFPVLPTYTGRAFTLQDWEKVFGSCEASTDVAGVFSNQLVELYPKAKVILTVRSFDKWYESMDEAIFKSLGNFRADMCVKLGSQFVMDCRKLCLGFFDAKTVDEARKNARMVYNRHHCLLQEKVPPEQLLIYTMGDGWEPLCQFLGKPVPDASFPWVNERAEHNTKLVEKFRSELLRAAKLLIPWIVGVGAVGAGCWWASSFLGY
ncbi:P-loop containing nucleoside triphosphate hydrolase protein [Hirsutella rhossiliensis]